MKLRIVFFLFAGVLLHFALFSGCTKDRTKVNEEIASASSIKGVIVEGAWTVHVFQREDATARIEYSAFLEDKITAEVRADGYLHLDTKTDFASVLSGGIKRSDLTAFIHIPAIELIKASGASDVTLNGLFHGQSCKIDLSGASDVGGFEYKGENVEISLGGASECAMAGEVNSAKISLKGASEASMLNFSTKTLDIKLSGASDTYISVEEKVTGELSGASSLEYRGDANVSEVKLSGGSDIKKIR